MVNQIRFRHEVMQTFWYSKKMNETYVKYVHPTKAVVLGLSNVASPHTKNRTLRVEICLRMCCFQSGFQCDACVCLREHIKLTRGSSDVKQTRVSSSILRSLFFTSFSQC